MKLTIAQLQHVLDITSREALARIDSQRHRDAEHVAWQRRTDKDRIIQAALDTLTVDSLDKSIGIDGPADYIAGAANIPVTQFIDYADRGEYIRELLAEIRAGLSPVVRG